MKEYPVYYKIGNVSYSVCMGNLRKENLL